MRKHFFLSVLVLFLIFSRSVQAQPPSPDSLVQWLQTNPEPDTNRVKNLVTLSNRLYRGYPDSARSYAKDGLYLAIKLNDLKRQASALRLIGYTHGVQGRSDSALYHFELALEIFKKLEDDRNIATINAAMATDFARNDAFERAINGFLEASTFFNKIGNIQAEGVMYSNIGNVFLEQELMARAYEYYEKAKETLLTDPSTKRNLSLVYTNLSIVSNALESYEDAIEYANQAIEINISYERFALLTSPYISKGRAQKALQRINEALKSFREAEKYNQIRGSLKTKAEIQFDIATVQYQLNDYLEAKEYIDLVIAGIKEHNLTLYETLPDALILSGKVEQQLGSYRIGLDRVFEATIIKDSLHNEEMALRISELETVYETEKKEAQIQFLEVENQVANLRILIISILGSVALIFMALGFWWYYRKKSEQKRIRMEAMKNVSYRNLDWSFQKRINLSPSLKKSWMKYGAMLERLRVEKNITSLVDSIHQNISMTEEEDELFNKIDQVNAGFYAELRLKSDQLTDKDERLATLVQMNLSNKDIANILHVEPDSVKRAKNRLKKKLRLDAQTDLTNYLKGIAA
ncbi:MAG: hypothetical protein BalsKO_21330 [Balneolaceae bacterium]